jgi:hypothetical protein
MTPASFRRLLDRLMSVASASFWHANGNAVDNAEPGHVRPTHRADAANSAGRANHREARSAPFPMGMTAETRSPSLSGANRGTFRSGSCDVRAAYSQDRPGRRSCGTSRPSAAPAPRGDGRGSVASRSSRRCPLSLSSVAAAFEQVSNPFAGSTQDHPAAGRVEDEPATALVDACHQPVCLSQQRAVV